MNGQDNPRELKLTSFSVKVGMQERETKAKVAVIHMKGNKKACHVIISPKSESRSIHVEPI